MDRIREIDTLSAERDGLGTDLSHKSKIIWKFVAYNAMLHAAALYGLILVPSAHYLTNLWAFFLWFVSVQGVMMGAHRLYAHRSFKATLIVRFVLILLHTVSGQLTLYRWTKDHRAHHKYTDTDADPQNTNRGLFFAHYGWLLVERHPLLRQKLRGLDDSDLKADKLVMFQKNHFISLHLLISLGIPIVVPVYFWGESLKNALYVCYFLRLIIVAHCILSINSISHAFGTKPYEKNIRATEKDFISYLTLGEGWHNYHHTFPWDYKAAELGSDLNITANLIEFLAYLGLVSGLRSPSSEMIKARVLRTGDGSHKTYK